jgi:dUTP pyrophosphatase
MVQGTYPVRQFVIIEGGKLPTKATPGSAAEDCYARKEARIDVGERVMIPLGFRMALPQGYCAKLLPRSGLARKNGLTILNSPGLIDSDYRGEINVILVNLGYEIIYINKGDRVCQMLIERVVDLPTTVVDALSSTERGHRGFGSTGK